MKELFILQHKERKLDSSPMGSIIISWLLYLQDWGYFRLKDDYMENEYIVSSSLTSHSQYSLPLLAPTYPLQHQQMTTVTTRCNHTFLFHIPPKIKIALIPPKELELGKLEKLFYVYNIYLNCYSMRF